MQRIDIETDGVEWDNGARLIHNGEPFTGEAVVHGFTGEVTSLVTYVDGLEEGPNREWYEDGPLKSEMTVHSGRVVGSAREWHENGQLARERRFDERGNVATEWLWDENGKPITDQGKPVS
jgi:antitoxin component YwqK of YwqJK toxin-antitoxin module